MIENRTESQCFNSRNYEPVDVGKLTFVDDVYVVARRVRDDVGFERTVRCEENLRRCVMTWPRATAVLSGIVHLNILWI